MGSRKSGEKSRSLEQRRLVMPCNDGEATRRPVLEEEQKLDERTAGGGKRRRRKKNNYHPLSPSERRERACQVVPREVERNKRRPCYRLLFVSIPPFFVPSPFHSRYTFLESMCRPLKCRSRRSYRVAIIEH